MKVGTTTGSCTLKLYMNVTFLKRPVSYCMVTYCAITLCLFTYHFSNHKILDMEDRFWVAGDVVLQLFSILIVGVDT